MVNLWLVLTICAAMAWGVNYAVTERVLHGGVSLFFMMFLNATVLMFFSLAVLIFGKGNAFAESVSVIKTGQVGIWMVVVYVASAFLGWCLVNSAIGLRNATSVSLIELSYPIFTIFFTWLLFRDVHLNLTILVGGLLIASGVVLIALKG